MVWARLDDAILDNPKIAAAGPLGFALHVAAITWCCRNLTDGAIPHARVTALLDLSAVSFDEKNPCAVPGGPRSMGGDDGLDPHIVADHLVTCGLWELTETGYQVHDFLKYNPSRSEVEATRSKGRNRLAKHREKRNSNAVSNGSETGLPVPVPLREEERPSVSAEQAPLPIPVPASPEVAELEAAAKRVWQRFLDRRAAVVRGAPPRLNDKRRQQIKARLRSYDEPRVNAAVDAMLAPTSWYVQEGRTTPEMVFRSDEQLEKHEAKASAAPGLAVVESPRPANETPEARRLRRLDEIRRWKGKAPQGWTPETDEEIDLWNQGVGERWKRQAYPTAPLPASPDALDFGDGRKAAQ